MNPTSAIETYSNTFTPAIGYATPNVDETRPQLHLRIGSCELAMPTDRVRAVVKVERLTLLPRADALICGVMQLDGEVVAVVDLAVRLGMGSSTLGRRSCVVIVDPPPPVADGEPMAWRLHDATREPPLGLLVDELHGLLDVPQEADRHAVSCDTSIPRALLAGTTTHRSRPVACLDLDRVLDPDALAGPAPCRDGH